MGWKLGHIFLQGNSLLTFETYFPGSNVLDFEKSCLWLHFEKGLLVFLAQTCCYHASKYTHLFYKKLVYKK